MMRPIAPMIAFHDGAQSAGDGGVATLLVFLGAVGTAAWLIFSTLRWRTTLLVTASGWIAIVALIWLW